MGVDFRILGPLEVLVDGVVVPLPSGHARVLLATLLLQANRVVSVDELVDRLWDGAPPNPARAKATLQMVVTRLRQALGSVDVVRTATGGYLADVEPGSLDLHRFRSLVQDGEFADALGLWRGSPLSNVESDSLHRDEAPALTDERLEVVERRIESDLDAGNLAGLVVELRSLTKQHPVRERFWAQLMLALYRSDQQAEALAAYRSVSGFLAEDLGVDPGPKLRELHQQILSSDSSLDGRRVAGRQVPRQLPSRNAFFVGRASELGALTELIDSIDVRRNAVVISAVNGTAGIGKTTLAVYWANRVADRFPDGQLYVNLRGFDLNGEPVQPNQAIRGFLDAFEIDPKKIPASLDAQVALYRSVLADRRVVLVLDNARDADQVRPLLPNSSSCLVVITSRNQLTGFVAQEGAHPITLDMLSRADAESLLVRRLGAARVEAEPSAVDRLVHVCAGLPLALAIVAARAIVNPRISLRDLADELSTERSRLDSLDTGDPATSVRTVFSWSYRQLSRQSATMFRQLSLHPAGSVSLSAAASVAGVSVDVARESLAELTVVNLLARGEAGRYAIYDLLRTYGVELAEFEDSSDQRERTLVRMFHWYMHTAHAAKLRMTPFISAVREPLVDGVSLLSFDSRDAALAWFEQESGNITALFRYAIAIGWSQYVGQLELALWHYLNVTSRWPEAVALSKATLGYLETTGDQQEELGVVLLNLGVMYGRLGNLDEAVECLTKSLVVNRAQGHWRNERKCLNNLGMAYSALGRNDEAIASLQQALEVCHRSPGREGENVLLDTLASIYREVGDHDEAERCLREALRLNIASNDFFSAGINLEGLGRVYHETKRYDEAMEVLREALEHSRRVSDRHNQATVLARLGDVLLDVGDVGAARENWRGALDLFIELKAPEVELIHGKLVAAPGGA